MHNISHVNQANCKFLYQNIHVKFCFFQCTQNNVDEGDSTLHFLCHGSSRDPNKMREYLSKFFKEHLEFLLQITSDILSCKKQPINDYISYILSESQPLDEIGICCFTHMYHLHVGIIMGTQYWTTHHDHDIQKCDKLLSFLGSLKFVSMKWKSTPENSSSEGQSEPEVSDSDTKQKPKTKRDNEYNLWPRKPQPASPEPEPEQGGYHLCSRDKKPAQKPNKKPPRPSNPPPPKTR